MSGSRAKDELLSLATPTFLLKLMAQYRLPELSLFVRRDTGGVSPTKELLDESAYRRISIVGFR